MRQDYQQAVVWVVCLLVWVIRFALYAEMSFWKEIAVEKNNYTKKGIHASSGCSCL